MTKIEDPQAPEGADPKAAPNPAAAREARLAAALRVNLRRRKSSVKGASEHAAGARRGPRI